MHRRGAGAEGLLLSGRVVFPWIIVGLAGALLVHSGCERLTDLPSVPPDVTAAEAGLDGLDRLAQEAKRLAEPLGPDERSRFAPDPPRDPLERGRWGLDQIDRGQWEDGLRDLGEALAARPASLVLGNRFRMAVYELKRESLARSRERGERAPRLPDYLAPEPLETLERIAERDPAREIELQIALAYVDRMVLNPALEIKAPASIDSVRTLTGILQGTDRHYVPALVARGLNYLYRPRDLVWPERPPPPRDAGSHDLALAVAVGRKVGQVGPRLRGLLLMTLGDAYAHEEEIPRARSWWLLAREAGPGSPIEEELAIRMGWTDAEIPDRLDERRERRMADQDHPPSDLSFLWDEEGHAP